MEKIKIIPSINVPTFSEAVMRIQQVEQYLYPLSDGARWIHVDVADNTFTTTTSWHNPSELKDISTPLFIEVHLMITRIDERIRDWLLPNVKRNIFHLETSVRPDAVIAACRKSGIEVGIAVAPATPYEALRPYMHTADMLQTLAVTPGLSGQKFQESTVEKLTRIRNECPSCVLEVDGGVRPGMVRRCAESGANLFVADTALFTAPDITKAYYDLKNDTQ